MCIRDRYIYYREPGNSLRPVNEVCSREGSTIYGQPYPLYNWSVAFYYTLSADEQIHIIPGVSSEITRLEQIPQETRFIFTWDSSGLVFQTEHAEDVRIDIVDTVGRIIAVSYTHLLFLVGMMIILWTKQIRSALYCPKLIGNTSLLKYLKE